VYYAALRSSAFFTARLVFDLAFDSSIHVAVVSHPSLLKHEDLDVRYPQTSSINLLSVAPQKYTTQSKAPLLINNCEHDQQFPKPFADLADEKFANFAPGYQRTYFAGVHHGFASRGDLVRSLAFLFGFPEDPSTFLCTERCHCEDCQGRGIQGVRGVVHQIYAVKRQDLSGDKLSLKRWRQFMNRSENENKAWMCRK
jgi:hypothetical protein